MPLTENWSGVSVHIRTHMNSKGQGTKSPPSRSTQPSTYESLDIWHALDYCG
jgi:hypothetical protein